MRNLEAKSGPWVGYWVQGRMKGHMRLSLHFSGGLARGEGVDGQGPFSVEGGYAEGLVWFIKEYRGSHAVQYAGAWNGQLVRGKWEIREYDFLDVGDFEIWPESESVDVTELLRQGDLVGV